MSPLRGRALYRGRLRIGRFRTAGLRADMTDLRLLPKIHIQPNLGTFLSSPYILITRTSCQFQVCIIRCCHASTHVLSCPIHGPVLLS
jgi:hypothetical protein